MVKEMEHATGVIVRSPVRLTEYRDLDPHGMARTRRIYTTSPDSNWNSGTFTYDGAGNITAIGSNHYLYDGLSRLTEGTAKDGGDHVKVRSYQYDGFGNLTGLNGTTINVSHATNRLTGSSYDTAGRELSWGTGSLTYHYTYYPTGEVRTTTGGSPELTRIFAYTAGGERIAASISAGPDTGINYTLRDLEGHVVRRFIESNGTWTWKEDHIWGPTGLLATVSPTDGTKHYVTDHLGSPRLVTDRCAHTLAQHNYYPYGEEATYADLDRERIKFTGQERDLGLAGQTTDDLDYMHARYYNLHLGRFLTTDPIGGRIGLSQSWNRYSYVLGNPVNLIDPFGLAENQYNGEGIGRHLAEAILLGDTTVFFDDVTVTASGDDAVFNDSVTITPSSGIMLHNPYDPIGNMMAMLLYMDITGWHGNPYPDGGIMARLAQQPQVRTGADVLKAMASFHCDTTWDRVFQNMATTNSLGLKVGGFNLFGVRDAGVATAGVLTGANVATKLGLPTIPEFLLGGARGMTVEGVSFTSVEAGALTATGAGAEFVLTWPAWQAGVFAGSLLNVVATAPCHYGD